MRPVVVAVVVCGLINEVLAFFQIKVFNHQIVGTDTNKYRLMILPYGVSLL